jgi:hypothetical protein
VVAVTESGLLVSKPQKLSEPSRESGGKATIGELQRSMTSKSPVLFVLLLKLPLLIVRFLLSEGGRTLSLFILFKAAVEALVMMGCGSCFDGTGVAMKSMTGELINSDNE